MFLRTFGSTIFRKRCALSVLAVVASVAMTVSAMAQEQVTHFARECAVMDIAVITMIEDHGAAGDRSADLLGEAGLAMLNARSTCYHGRVSEALALYQSILDLGPVASLRRKSP